MELYKITASDRAALKTMVASEGWEVAKKIYDNFRISLIANFIDGPEMLPEGMAVQGYNAKYSARGATSIINLVENISEGKDLESATKKATEESIKGVVDKK